RTRHLAGVESAALGVPPLSGWDASYSSVDSSGHSTVPIDEIYAGRGYFETIGARLVTGRAFNDGDMPGSPPVVVVNEALARRLFPDGKAVGRTMASSGGKAT